MARQKAFDKEEVLDKAMYLFWKKGYNGTSMQDLVDHLGISRSSMYDTFGGKHNLFLNTLSRYQSRQAHQVDQALATEDELEDFLKSFFMGVVDECRQDEEHKGCFTVNTSVELAPHDEQIGAVVGEDINGFVEKFEKFFEKAQDSWQLASTENPKTLALMVYNTMAGIRLVSRTNPADGVLETIAETAAHKLLAN